MKPNQEGYIVCSIQYSVNKALQALKATLPQSSKSSNSTDPLANIVNPTNYIPFPTLNTTN